MNEDVYCDQVVNSSSSSGKTCVINATVTTLGLSIHFPGNILFANDAAITATRDDFWVQADGNITFEGNAKGHVEHGAMVLHGDQVVVSGNASLKVHGVVNITAKVLSLEGNACIESESDLHIAGTVVVMSGAASTHAVNVSIMSADGPSPGGDSSAIASHVDLSASIVAGDVDVVAEGDTRITGSLRGPGVGGSRGVSVRIVTLRNFTMDLLGGQWDTGRFWVVADQISMINQTVKTGGTSCGNRQSSKLDQCTQYLELAPLQPNATRGGAPGPRDANVSFDLQLVAHGSLALQSVHLAAGSMLVCSGGALSVELSTLDAKGRGCGPGEGWGRGAAGGAACRAGGGGSHVGGGGAGANYSTTAVQACARGGAGYDAYDLPSELLPTRAASGGGCSLQAHCPGSRDSVTLPASAGGLIWMSGLDVSLKPGVQVVANGNQGIANETKNASDVSGAGAGGHIFLWAHGGLHLDAAQPALLSVNGGDIQCSHRQVSGAGGGGFIGIHYAGEPVAVGGLALSYSGGAMQDQCLAWPPQVGLAATYGRPGLASSVLPCPAGRSGPLCQTCGLGLYANGTSACQECANKPASNSEYTAAGWPNSSCPYKCSAGVPDYRTNPMCLPAPSYVFHFFGGLGGALVILVCLVLVSGYFLYRRRSLRKRQLVHWRREFYIDSFIGACAGGLLSRGCSACRDHLCCFHTQDTRADGELVFTKEQLPYHVCRVYLDGQNDRQLPWSLGGQLPAAAGPLVQAEQWERLAAELGAAAEVPGAEGLYAAVLGAACPPFAAPLACWFRRRRARLLRACARRFSEGASCAVFWRPIRARVHPAGELAMVFGCDYGATLGYLDFFDFSRSQLDWAPVDLRQDARLLVAHGKGSYADPFALDIGDPLVTHLAQSDLGAVAVCTVISTFNRIARSIGIDELAWGTHSPKVLRLRRKVEQCAAQCGLAGFVQVFTCQQHPAAPRGASRASPSVARSDTDTSFMDLMPPRRAAGARAGARAGGRGSPPEPRPAPGARPPSPAHAHAHASAPWAAEAAAAAAAEEAAAPPGLSPSGAGPFSSAGGAAPAPAPARRAGVKLCLAFVDGSALSVACGGLSPPSAAAPGPEALLTSPMALSSLGEHLEQGSSGALGAIGETSSFARTVPCRQWWRLPPGKDHGSTTPATVLVMVIVLLFADLLAFVIVGVMLFEISYSVFALWILVPPFTQPLALVLGPLFMLSELPRLGRLYASLSICGTVSAAVSTIALLTVQQVDSWFFNFAELLTVCVLKTALYLFTNMHVRNLETAWDMSFMDAPQAEFLGHLLSTESSRQVAALPVFEHADHLLARVGFDRRDHGGDEIQFPAERWPQRPEPHSRPLLPPRLPHAGQGALADSFLQAPLRAPEELSAAKAPLSIGGSLESLRHSTGRSWDVPSGSSPSEASPF